MLKILDLFSGTQSVRKAFPNCDYRGIDIYSPEEENIILDLTQDNIVEKLKEKLGDWKPDFIWASPICNALSLVNPGLGGNFNFILDKETETIRIRDKDFGVGVGRNYRNKEKWTEEAFKAVIIPAAKMSLKLFENTKKIIDYFNVPFAIENPAYALSRYLLKDYNREVVHYCRYGQDRQKPTAIYTNYKFQGLKCNHKGKHSITHNQIHKSELKNTTQYAARASVPPKLIREIISQAIGKES